VSVASMALSTVPDQRRPALVIARRVAFHLKRNAFSRWKYKQADAAICSSNAIRATVIEDGIPESAAFTVYEGVEADRIQALQAADVCKELWLPPGSRPSCGPSRRRTCSSSAKASCGPRWRGRSSTSGSSTG
jgi:hypothetical protein